MSAELKGGLSLGLSGFIFWSHYVGGFATKSPENLYRRWAPFRMLTSHVRSHGEPPREPWLYSKDFLEGFHHLLIEGWTPQWYENHMHMFSFTKCADNFDIDKVVEYGNKKGVELIGYHETGSNLINYLKEIDAGFALYKKLGMHSVKIGHVGSKLNMKEWHHGQFGVNYFRYVLEKAAQ